MKQSHTISTVFVIKWQQTAPTCKTFSCRQEFPERSNDMIHYSLSTGLSLCLVGQKYHKFLEEAGEFDEGHVSKGKTVAKSIGEFPAPLQLCWQFLATFLPGSTPNVSDEFSGAIRLRDQNSDSDGMGLEFWILFREWVWILIIWYL